MLARRTDGTTGTTRAVAYFVSVGSHLVLTTHLIDNNLGTVHKVTELRLPNY